MDARARSTLRQLVYQDFVPTQNSVEDEESETLLIELPGFRKEQLEIQIDDNGKMRISGQRPLSGNRWSRFRREHQVPEKCNSDEIRAKLENGVLSITLPKLATKSGQRDKSTTTAAVASQVIPEPKPAGVSQAEEHTRRRTISSSPTESCNGSSGKQHGLEKISGEAAAAREGEAEKDKTREESAGSTTVAGGRGGTRLFGLPYWWPMPWFVIVAALAVCLRFYMVCESRTPN